MRIRQQAGGDRKRGVQYYNILTRCTRLRIHTHTRILAIRSFLGVIVIFFFFFINISILLGVLCVPKRVVVPVRISRTSSFRSRFVSRTRAAGATVKPARSFIARKADLRTATRRYSRRHECFFFHFALSPLRFSFWFYYYYYNYYCCFRYIILLVGPRGLVKNTRNTYCVFDPVRSNKRTVKVFRAHSRSYFE